MKKQTKKNKTSEFSEKESSGYYTRFAVKIPAKLKDNINPEHYKGEIETFDYLMDKLTEEELSGFCKGNIIKYVTREKHKGGVEDLKKARWYLEKLIYNKS